MEAKVREGAERLIVRLYYRGDCWLTADATDMPWYVLEPWLADMQKHGCRVEIKKVSFPCSGSATVADVAWLLATPSDEEEVTDESDQR